MNEYFLQRHFKLWEDHNKQLNRVVFLTVVLSMALVVKVLIPFVDFSAGKKPVIEAIASLNEEKQLANEKIARLSETTRVLEDVNKYISRQPWQKDKRDLIKRYKDMRDSPPAEGYSRERYQQEANDTVNKIADQSQKNILLPLQKSTLGIETGRDTRHALSNEVGSLKQFFDDWKNQYIDRNWYSTLNRKESVMVDLTERLNQRMDDFSDVLKSEMKAVNQAKIAVDTQLKVLDSRIVSNEDKLQVLDDELQKILPEWLRGFINIEQVIQLLPAILLATAIFVVTLGASLTRHFEIYISGNKLSKEITDDPGMSSTWTLIHRGFPGTIFSIAAYMLFIIFTWVLFEKSMLLLSEWLSIDPSKAWISSHGFWMSFLWLSRAGFIGLIIYMLNKFKKHMVTNRA